MRDLALARGTPAAAIVMEEQATNTLENALCTLPCLAELHATRALVVTSDYHMPRARLIFEAVYRDMGIVLDFAEVGHLLLSGGACEMPGKGGQLRCFTEPTHWP